MTGYIQSNSVDTSGSTGNVSFSSNVTAHSTLVLMMRVGTDTGPVSISSVTDNVNGAWTKRFSTAHHTVGIALDCWYFLNAAAGATTVTFNLTGGSTTLRCAIAEGVIDATNGDSVDTSNSAETTGSSASSGSITTANAVEWLVSGCITNNTNTPTAGTGYTLRQSPGSKDFLAEKTTGSSGSYVGDFSLSPSDDYVAGVIAFKAAVM